jgi:hypothetical protein
VATAREVLRADEPNLPSISFSAPARKEIHVPEDRTRASRGDTPAPPAASGPVQAADAAVSSATPDSGSSGRDELRALEDRINQLEQLVQGLQDSVHREATRQGKRIADLEARLDPTELSRDLSTDAPESRSQR